MEKLGLEAVTAGFQTLTRPVSTTTSIRPSGDRFTWQLLSEDEPAFGPSTATPLGLAEFDLEPDGDSDNHWLTVESNKPTGRFTTVYNFSVADWHTYFVASNDDLDVAIWAHNTYDPVTGAGRLRDPKTGRFIPDPDNPPSPYVMTDAQRRAHWKRLADDPNSPLDDVQRAQVKARGNRGPQQINDRGELETMELSHEPIPLREGGTEVVPRWPADHAARDPHRHLKKVLE